MKMSAIASALERRGVKVLKIEESDEPEVEDDSLQITEEVHVQVGVNYLIANRWSEAEQAMYSGPSRSRSMAGVELLSADLKAMVKAAEDLKG